ncbi:MAG: LysR substrate-binding domain-containing protein [Burkholderiaceae bacterium]
MENLSARDDLDLTSLRLFVLVCEERSVTRAADRAALAASAISKRLAALEARWETPLLVRKRYGMVPTAAGETLLGHARAILQQAQRAQRSMRDHGGGVRGQVRVLGTASNIAQGLVEDIAAFLHQPAHRDIRVDFEESISPEITRRVADGEAALGVAWDEVDLRGLSSSPYIRDQLAVVVPDDHPLAGQAGVAFVDTLAWEQVGLPVTSLLYQITAREAARADKALEPRVVMANHEISLRAVAARLAIALAPRDIAREFSQRHPVAVVPLTDAWAKRQFVICHHPPAMLSPAARTLLLFLAQRRGV